MILNYFRLSICPFTLHCFIGQVKYFFIKTTVGGAQNFYPNTWPKTKDQKCVVDISLYLFCYR